MNKEFIPYQEALALKELGFNEPCLGYYYTDNESNYKEHNYDYRRDFVIDAFQTKDGTYDSYVVNKKEIEYYVATPTHSQAYRFFREKYKLNYSIETGGKHGIQIANLTNLSTPYKVYVGHFATYEEAELACLRALIYRARELTIGENTGPRG